MHIPKIYSAESVAAGHPDKVCDQISDAILDECLKQDPMSRVAVECFGSHGLLVIGGEVTTTAQVDYEVIARGVYASVGYDPAPLRVLSHVVEQSPEIALGVNTGGAGDQGIMYGFATNETSEYLPKGVVLSHKLAKAINDLPDYGSDGKSQVTIIDNKVKKILVSIQHKQDVELEKVRETVLEQLILPVLGDISGIEIFINPAGTFVVGGFEADAGLTGRKIMVDTYGGLIPHGGGCFSGKDPTKVDRSAAYMARFVAKNIVAGGNANQCLVSVAYAIGKAQPLMVYAINEKGEDISRLTDQYDFRPQAIIERLALLQPLYFQTASYGHFGKTGLPWENV